jgi:translation initiation factor 4E
MSKDTAELSNATASLTLDDTSAGSDVSVGAPNEESEQRHPLEHRWTYFYNPPNKAAADGSWSSNVKAVSTFSTVEDFWCLVNALKSPSQLTIGSNYHMFKEGIQPEV